MPSNSTQQDDKSEMSPIGFFTDLQSGASELSRNALGSFVLTQAPMPSKTLEGFARICGALGAIRGSRGPEGAILRVQYLSRGMRPLSLIHISEPTRLALI
eukprot:318113-Alexandrium_andersonii.AAC.1